MRADLEEKRAGHGRGYCNFGQLPFPPDTRRTFTVTREILWESEANQYQGLAPTPTEETEPETTRLATRAGAQTVGDFRTRPIVVFRDLLSDRRLDSESCRPAEAAQDPRPVRAFRARWSDQIHGQPTRAICSRLVVPELPNGMPAAMTMVWPGCAKPRFRTVSTATSVISETLATSWHNTALTPQTSDRQRAVARLGVMPMIGARGRSRAMRKADEPELV